MTARTMTATGSAAFALDLFARVVASGDVHRAAHDVGLSGDEVEAELAALERRLGFSLFNRTFGVHTLTETGRRTVAALDQLSREMVGDHVARAPERAPEPEVADTQIPPAPVAPPPAPVATPASTVRSITLAAHPTLFTQFQEALTAFEDSNPDISITMRLAPLSASEAAEQFARGDADIAYFHTLRDPVGMDTRYAWSEPVSLFIGSAHPLAQADAVEPADLADTPYVAVLAGDMVRALCEAALERTGLACPWPVAEAASAYDLMQMVRDGAGYCVMAGPMAREFARMSDISRLRYAAGLPQIEVRQAINPARADDAAVQALGEYLFRV